MAVPEFVTRDNQLTDDGRKLLGFIEAQFSQIGAENDVAALNAMAGPFKQFYVDVHKMRFYTPEQWMTEFAHSYARNAWNILEHVEQQAEQAAQVEATAETTNEIAESLKALKEELSGQIAALKGENTKLRNQLKGLKEQIAAGDDDSDDTEEATPDEDEGESE